MTDHGVEKKPGPFAALRQHYRDTRPDHRPVPVVLPLLVVTALAVAAYLLLDPHAASMYDAWPDWVRKPARFFTDLGKSWWIITGSVVVIIAGILLRQFSSNEGRRRLGAQVIAMATYVLASVAISGLISNLVKRAIGRPRPEMFGDHGLFTLNPFAHDSAFESFPSGHATTDGAFWTALALLYPPLRWPFLIVGFYLALTRIFVSAHYPSDVLVGFGWGMWFAFLMAVLFARHGLVFSHKDGKLAKLI
ncbi:phosphatase PAP2 family protein [Rhizobium sp. TH2]|uniref:phosphatase PAP2 family protein n=1 Tax=Rhizobium sp. TH2 TaxID=2775403 RepID=UPI002157C0C8|nr:phosphatase PAP2 family protein [Rhizobium sp. TH2]UVC08433.1 phosphatase PAP2 family protein [Rhizobium sp. TH2]